MNPQILQAIGGVGLFLLGMTMLTDGLRALAGTALRNFLKRSTRSPASGALAGALTTAVIQSSSATTVAAVGFVGAGLITFGQALGIIFGANIGTTATGWLVAVLGFKLQLGEVVMPLVLGGMLLRIFGRGRWRDAGWATAGFSLLFVGISVMQNGMAFLNDAIRPESFPADTLIGRLELVLIGIAITVVTQSSSAGVATALAAIGIGAINFTQAAALVIGMDVGTTFTAVLATIGGSTAMRRTGYAHVIYNVMTAILAFSLLGPLSMLVSRITGLFGVSDAQIELVAFHTTFNFLGVVAVLAFTRQFAAFVTWLVPERGPALTARLDERLLSDPAAAADAMTATIGDIARFLFTILGSQLESGVPPAGSRLETAENALEEARQYGERIRTRPNQLGARQRQVAALHALDHLLRLYDRCRQQERIETIVADGDLKRHANEIVTELRSVLAGATEAEAEQRLNLLRRRLREAREKYRETTIAQATEGNLGTYETLARLDAMRWLHRVSYHLWRIVHHRHASYGGEAAPPAVARDG